jgi:hypothetical protein
MPIDLNGFNIFITKFLSTVKLNNRINAAVTQQVLINRVNLILSILIIVGVFSPALETSYS